MERPKLHPGNLLVLAADAKKMDALKVPLNQALAAAVTQNKPDLEAGGILVALAKTGDTQHFVTEIAVPLAIRAELRPVLTTIDLVVEAIRDAVKDSAPDDDDAFDKALTLTAALLKQRNIEPKLAPIFAETGMAMVHDKAFADTMIVTLYADGRLLVVKGSLLGRLLQAHKREQQNRATAAR